jgi:hypothetical protein
MDNFWLGGSFISDLHDSMQLFGVSAHGYKMAGKLLYLHELMKEVS